MKQTNNAIKFLMAQYRAIFKNAYFKGMATALVLTAGLAAGQAQADVYEFSAMGTYDYNTAPNVTSGSIGTASSHVAGAINNTNSPNLVTSGDLVIGAFNPGEADITTLVPNKDASSSYNAFGGFGRLAIGDLSVVDNKITIQSSAGVVGNIYGGYARADAGNALVSGNNVNYSSTWVSTFVGGNNDIYGALATGKTGATASDNHVVYGQDNARTLISLQNKKTLVGGQADTFNGATGGNFVAQENSLTLRNIGAVPLTDTGYTLAGGRAVGDSGAAGTIAALGNTLSLDNVTFDISGNTAANTITGNAAITVASSFTGDNVAVSANGVDNEISVHIKNSTLTGSGSAIDEVKTTIAGGLAQIGSTSGSATANSNRVLIEDSDVSSMVIYGGTAQGSGDFSVSASNNTIEITSSDTDVGNSISTFSIVGGQATLQETSAQSDPDTIDTSKTLTASNNRIVIGANVKVSGTNIMAAELVSGGDASYLADNNSIEVSGKVSNGQLIAVKSDGLTETNNATVDVKNGAELSNVDIFGGTGSDSVVTLENGSKYVITNDDTEDLRMIVSDAVNIAGNVTIGQDKILAVRGYSNTGETFANSDPAINSNLTKLENGAVVDNAGQLRIYGLMDVADNATINAKAAGATIYIDGSYADSITDPDDIPADAVGGYGTLVISQAKLTDYLSADSSDINDHKGAVVSTSGATIDFRDSVVLSDFDFNETVSAEGTAGFIQVDGALTNGGSIFKADTVNIEHTLASDTTTVDSSTLAIKPEYTPIGAQGIIVKANTLNLGTSSLAGEKTDDIKFGFAEVTSEVNFANGALSKTYTDSHPTDKYAGYRLATDLRLDAKQEVQNDIGTTDKHYHALTGTINGDVKVQTNGEINVINGSWTANDTVTLASGGSIHVGNIAFKDVSGESLTENVFVTDAILTLDHALDIDLSDDTGAGSVSVSGDGGYYDLQDYGTDDAHQNERKLALLDLRAGINLIDAKKPDGSSDGYKSIASFSASNGGVILVDGSNLSDLLAASTVTETDRGINFSINSNAQLVAEGAVTADFGDFGNGSTDINLGTNGHFVAESLTLNHDETDTTPGAQLVADATYIGGSGNDIKFVGIVQVDELTIADTTRTQKASGSTVTSPYASQVDVLSGNVEIAKSLTVQNNTLNVSGASFVFATDSVAESGAITVNNITVAQKGAAATDSQEIAFTNGTWDATGTTFTLNTGAGLQVGGDTGEDINDLETEAVVNINRVVANAGSNIDVEGDGNLTISTVDFSKLAANSEAVKVRGNLTIEGDASYTVSGSTTPTRNGVLFGGAGSIVVENNGHLTFGSDATTGAIIANGNHSTDSVTLVEGFTQIKNNGGEVELGLASGTTFSAKGVLDLKTKLFTSDSLTSGILNNGGVLNIGDAGFQGIELTDDGDGTYTATWEQMKSWSDIETNADVTNSRLTKTNVTGIKVSDQVRGHYGALRMDASAASNAQVDLYGHTSLRFAEGNNGKFISNADGSAALGAKVAAGKSLTLINGGEIGAITLEDGSNGDTELTVKGTGETTIASINGDATNNYEDSVVYINGVTNVTAGIADVNLVEVTSNLTANKIDVQELAALNGSITADTITVEEGTVFGGTITAKNFTYETNASDRTVEAFNGGKLVVTDTLKVANNGDIFVGFDLTDADRDLLALEGYTNVTGTGYLETNVLDLNGGTLYVDPAYGEDTSLAAIKTFKADKSFTVANNVGNADGNIFVGKNAAVGIGTDLAGLQEAIDAYQEGGSLSADKYGSIMYLNGQAKLAANTLVALDSDIDIDTDSQFRQVREYTENGSTLLADMGLGDKTALIMSTNAFADKDGNKTGTAITFDKDRAVINNEGSVIILQGSFATGDELNFFNDKGNDGIKLVGQNLEFFSENGFLKGVIEVGENVGLAESLEVDRPHAYNIMHEASDPVVESLIAYGNRNVTPTTPAPETPEQEQQPDQQPSVNDPNADTGDGTTVNTSGSSITWTELTPATNTDSSKDQPNKDDSATTVAANNSTFLDAVITTSHGAPAEAAARLAIYGGAVQAAMAATSSTTDAIAARMGVGNTANITMANNGQGAALWLAPVYKTHDSDSFDSQGLDYGVDMNLYGVALGADFEFMPGLKAGVMFNVGSGDADGQGNAAAEATSNDFDYWGAAIYGNYTYDALSVTADVSYTAVDNDLEATTGMDQFTKLESSTDTTVISLGVTAKYTFDLAGVEVAPHAGLRYTNIDLDDYSIKSNGESIADYSADKVNIFSIPVGVTFAKEFTGDAWTVKPSLDLTLTGNFGDDDISGDVSWTGVDGLVTPVSSEYMDDFTYGATLGIEAASTGGFSLGLGVNYTGSSNVDEFGVNANARFVF